MCLFRHLPTNIEREGDCVTLGYRTGKCTNDAIYVVKRMQEKRGSKGKELCYETGRKVVRELCKQSLC